MTTTVSGRQGMDTPLIRYEGQDMPVWDVDIEQWRARDPRFVARAAVETQLHISELRLFGDRSRAPAYAAGADYLNVWVSPEDRGLILAEADRLEAGTQPSSEYYEWAGARSPLIRYDGRDLDAFPPADVSDPETQARLVQAHVETATWMARLKGSDEADLPRYRHGLSTLSPYLTPASWREVGAKLDWVVQGTSLGRGFTTEQSRVMYEAYDQGQSPPLTGHGGRPRFGGGVPPRSQPSPKAIIRFNHEDQDAPPLEISFRDPKVREFLLRGWAETAWWVTLLEGRGDPGVGQYRAGMQRLERDMTPDVLAEARARVNEVMTPIAAERSLTKGERKALAGMGVSIDLGRSGCAWVLSLAFVVVSTAVAI
jgi:hypothetical protein